jgi:hypothetical protein
MLATVHVSKTYVFLHKIFTTIKVVRGRLPPLVLPSVNLHRSLASINLHRPPAHAHVRPPASPSPTPREPPLPRLPSPRVEIDPPPKSNLQTPGHCCAPPPCRCAVERRRASSTHPMAMEVRRRVPPPHGSPTAPAGDRRRGAAGACAGGGRAAAADPAHEPHLLGAVRRVAGVPDAAVAGEDPRLHAAPRGLPRQDLRSSTLLHIPANSRTRRDQPEREMCPWAISKYFGD